MLYETTASIKCAWYIKLYMTRNKAKQKLTILRALSLEYPLIHCIVLQTL